MLLLSQMYEVNDGEIWVNDAPTDEMNVDEWRSMITVVRQNPFILNDLLGYNLTIGNRNVSEAELDRVVRIARVDKFFDYLPNGTDHNSATRVFDSLVGRNSGLHWPVRC